MAKQPDKDLVEYLVANVTTVQLVEGRNIFSGQVQPAERGVVDELAIFIIPFSGPEPESFLGCAKSRWMPELQLWFRGPKRKSRWKILLELAREARNVLHSDNTITVPGYTDVRALESAPLPRADDDDGRPQATLNVRMEYFE